MGGDEAGWRRKGVCSRFHVAVTATLVLLAKAMGRDGGERVVLMSNLQCVECRKVRFACERSGDVTMVVMLRCKAVISDLLAKVILFRPLLPQMSSICHETKCIWTAFNSRTALAK